MAINTKLSVSGLAGYKRDLETAKQSVKDLSGELALNEAEFQRDGDKASYLKRKVYILQQQIQAQQSVVEKANSAMQNAATQYGEGSKQAEAFKREVVKGKTALAQMQTRLNETEQALAGVGEQAAGEDGAAGKVSTLQETLQGLAQNVNMETLKKGLGDIADTIAGAAKKAANLAAELWKATTDAGSWADDLLTQSTQTGIDTTTLQQWQYAAQFVDTEAETIIGAQAKIVKAMQKEGGMTVGDMLIPTRDEAGNARAWDDVMWDAVDALNAMGEGADQDAAAMALFGKSYKDMLPLIRAGRAEWEKAMAEAPTLSEDQVKALGELDDAVNTMNSALEGSKLQLLSALAPVMQAVADAIAQVAQSLGEYLQTEEGQELLSKLGETLSGLVGTVLSPENLETAFNAITEGANALGSALEWISENKDGVVTALKAIGAGFLGLKVGEGVLEVVRFVNAGKNLSLLGLGGKAAAATGTGAGVGTAAGAGGSVLGGALAKVLASPLAGVALPLIATAPLATILGEKSTEAYAGYNAIADVVRGDTSEKSGNEALLAELVNLMDSSAFEGTAPLADFLMQHQDVFRKFASEDDPFWAAVDSGAFDNAEDLVTYASGITGDTMTKLGADMAVELAAGIAAEAMMAEEAAGETGEAVAEAMDASDEAKVSGENISIGLANGIRKGAPEAYEAAGEVAEGVVNTIQSALDIQSPSRVMAALGAYVGEGFALGIEDSLAQVRDASAAMSAAAFGGAVDRPRTRANTGLGLDAGSLGLALRSALSGVQVNMSGQAVGEIVADTVDEQIGRSAYNARYNT